LEQRKDAKNLFRCRIKPFLQEIAYQEVNRFELVLDDIQIMINCEFIEYLQMISEK
jgi:hypothetical protein